MDKKLEKKHLFALIGFAIIWNIFILHFMPSFATTNDTTDYFPESIRNLGWPVRTPGYPLFLFAIKTIVGAKEWEAAFPAIVMVQIVISIVCIYFFYDSLQKILRNTTIALIFSYLYAIIVAIYGYPEFIMPESLSISCMVLCVWIVVQILETGKMRYFVSLSLFVLWTIMIKPAMLFLIAVVPVFLFVLWLNKFHKKELYAGIFSYLFCMVLLMGYCNYNKQLTGYAMLCTIPSYNEVGILVQSDMYENENYPEVSAFIRERADTDKTAVRIGVETCDEFGFSYVAEYLQDTRKLYIKDHIKRLLRDIGKTAFQPIVHIGSRLNITDDTYDFFHMVQKIVLPINYCILLLMMLAELLYGIAASIKLKQMQYMSFGISGCVLAIYLTSMIALLDADVRRYMVHMIPLAMMLEAMLVNHLWNFVKNRKRVSYNK